MNQSCLDDTGIITDFQDFAVHDGPGLRVLLFLKGCPLSCAWCQNPESLNATAEIAYHEINCRECFQCKEVCPVPEAILEDKTHRIDRTKCTKCMRCVDACKGKALRRVGDTVSVRYVTEKVARYRPFFESSDCGGLTISGGEPTFQPKFTFNLLQRCRELGIHTTIETCGYSDYETLRRVAQNADLVLYDLKHPDEQQHIKGTSKSNKLIFDNLRGLCKEVDTEIAVRIPLVPGFNDNDEVLREILEFVRSLKKVSRLDLLPFNVLPSGKYRTLGLAWEYIKVKQQPPEELLRFQKIVQSYKLTTTVGGLW